MKVEAVGVVVPVHDEDGHLSICLEAIGEALAAIPPTVERFAVAVLDSCVDRSASIARAWVEPEPAIRHARHVQLRNVGAARAFGMQVVLERFARRTPSRIWLTTTDADSCVPRSWLTDQLALAADGVDAVAGAIEVNDWTLHPPGTRERFAAFYEPPGSDDTHTHVHGANLGVRADAYLAAGGFASLETGEDHALWNALKSAERRRVSSRRLAVITSARLAGRAPHGFSGFLRALPTNP